MPLSRCTHISTAGCQRAQPDPARTAAGVAFQDLASRCTHAWLTAVETWPGVLIAGSCLKDSCFDSPLDPDRDVLYRSDAISSYITTHPMAANDVFDPTRSHIHIVSVHSAATLPHACTNPLISPNYSPASTPFSLLQHPVGLGLPTLPKASVPVAHTSQWSPPASAQLPLQHSPSAARWARTRTPAACPMWHRL